MRSLFYKDRVTYNAVEKSLLTKLACDHAKLMSRLQSNAEAGELFTAVFSGIHTLRSMLKVEVADRRFRKGFSENYRALLPGDQSNYRRELLEACIETSTVIWVNGKQFEFSAEVRRAAEALRHAWNLLGQELQRWQHRAEPKDCPERSRLCTVLHSLDVAWAAFEQRYIKELMDIEGEAKRYIADAIRCEKLLQVKEKEDKLNGSETAQEAKRSLVRAMSTLNSVANSQRKGRDDLDADVLLVAEMWLSESALPGPGGSSSGSHPAVLLAADVVASFEAFREYLRQAEGSFSEVDPHLCNNVVLVARLVAWEECWEAGMRYFTEVHILEAVSDFVAAMQRLHIRVPRLQTMCEERDVEFLFLLPRFLWLRFLLDPEKQSALIERLLPHGSAEDQDCVDDMLATFKDMSECITNGECTQSSGAWVVLAQAVVLEVPLADLPVAEGQHVLLDAGVGAMMHKFHSFAMQLQRQAPEDWNHLGSLLSRCLSARVPLQRSHPRCFIV
mmetsp:Transcript_17617/g.40764  ORF Transcript_17617/g.40764 Transcript_17617/m.40764 type:complete len:503 (-) Transcript_17617:79-1587(-)